MAGTGWKAIGTIFIVVGAAGLLLGLAGAVFGGVMFSDAMSDANDCSLFNPCDEDELEARGEASVYAAMAGGGLFVIGLVVTIVGVVLVFIGSKKAQQAQLEALRQGRAPLP